MNNKFDKDITIIARQFLCCVPIQEISWMNTFTILTNDYDLQETFISKTVNLPINIKYPIKISYQVTFLKEVISKLEKQNAEIHDDVYSAYGRLMSQPNQEQFFYKHYFTANSDKPITLKESASLISDGTTGLRTWQHTKTFTMNNKFDKDITIIARQFLCCVPIQEISWMNTFTILTNDYDLQETFISKTVNLPINIKYPIKISYQVTFLKEVISKLEKQNAEIHDDVYSAYGRLMSQPNQEQFFYKHYFTANSDKPITLKESASLISDGTTGLRTWQASLALCEWMLHNKQRFQNQKILELGSGIGLTGLVTANECIPDAIYLTDCHSSVLDVLCDNIKLNVEEVTYNEDSGLENRYLYKTLGPPKISVLNLPWEEIDQTFCQALGPINTVIAADIVYDKDLFEFLIGAINNLCNISSVHEFIFSCTERNPETLQLFHEKIVEAGFRINELQIPEQNNFFWPKDVIVKIFRFIK